MCAVNNECDYEGQMLKATGPKDVSLDCVENDKEYRIPCRLTVSICPECQEPDWMTLC